MGRHLDPFLMSDAVRWVLPDWYPTFPGLHVFYPSRREYSKALSVVVDALRTDT